MKDEYLEYLIEEYPMVERFGHILEDTISMLESIGITNNVSINMRLLKNMIVDYFVDIDRLKSFEQIGHINTDKIYSYSTYWFLKNKPIQITGNIDSGLIKINEKIALLLFMSKLLKDCEVKRESFNEDHIKFSELLLYNFNYRTFTQKSLELAAAAFRIGIETSKERE